MNDNEEYYNRRKIDNEREKFVTTFLEQDVLYKFPTYKRINNAELQKQGIDFEFFGKKKFFHLCDLKTIMPRQNGKKLETACLECASRYLSKKNEWIYTDGWFLNENEKTNTLVMFWIDKCTNGLKSIEDIKEYEYCFILNETIWKYLKLLGWDKSTLKKKIEEVKNNPENYFRTQWINDIGFNTPKRLYNKERPVNILLKREFYIKNSIYSKKGVIDNN